MRVLHVDTSQGWRGGQTQLLHLLRARPGDAVVMRPDAAWRSAVEALGNVAHFVPFRAWRGTAALARVVRNERPVLVAAHTSHAHGHAWLAGGAPLVVHRRSDFAPGPLSGPKYRAPSGYVAVSAAVRDVLVRAGVPRERVAVVPDGVDPIPFDSPRSASGGPECLASAHVPRIGAVGALVAHKGHEVLVEAVARLRARGVAAELRIAGEGDRRGALEGLAASRGVPLAMGPVADVPAWLGTIDVFAHPSHEEGLGQAVIEAMLAGVPVVASAAGGVPEVVAPGTGLLVPPGDPDALARALRSVIADPSGATERAAVGRRHAQRFSVAALVAGTEAAWAASLERA